MLEQLQDHDHDGTFSVVNTSDCTCPHCNLTYECTVNASAEAGYLFVWSGSILKNSGCENDQILLYLPGSQHECSRSGSITGNLDTSSGNYVSKVDIKLDSDIMQGDIECGYYSNDNESRSVITPIGRAAISVNVHDRYDKTEDWLNFAWNSSIFEGPAINYSITSSNCGTCPTQTSDTTVNCTAVPTDGRICVFTVQVLVCGHSVGNVSRSVQLRTQPAEPSSNTYLVLLPTLTSVSGVFVIAVVIAGVIILIRSLYKRYNSFSQSTGPVAATTYIKAQESNGSESHIKMEDTRIYDDTTVKVFDNKLATGIYGDTVAAAPKAQYEDYVPNTPEEKLDLAGLLAYLRGRVTFQWYKFGASLGVPPDALEKIVKDSEMYSEEQALIRVLEYWLKNHPTEPNWQEVADALRDIIWTS